MPCGGQHLRFRSVCSGIDAASVAWKPLGWECVELAEIEPFPCAVLEHHYPEVPNAGDFTSIRKRPQRQIAPADVLVGGTPCQSFSVAGLRKGMDDARGQLTFEFLRLAHATRPRWVVWENVPGVLSSGGGRDFGAFLGGLAELGYGWAYRVLDAQYVGVPQRRRRVFVVGHLGDRRRAAAVLFERHSLSGDPPPGRGEGEVVAGTLASRSRAGGGLGTDFDLGGGLIPAFAVQEDNQNGVTVRGTTGSLRADAPGSQPCGSLILKHVACTLPASNGGASSGYHPVIPVQNATRGKSQNGLGVGEPGDPMYTLDNGSSHAVALPFDTTQITSAANYSNPRPGDPCHPLAAGAHAPAIAFHANQDPISGEISPCLPTHTGHIAIAFMERGRDAGRTVEWQEEVAYCQDVKAGGGAGSSRWIAHQWAVRRLTPLECERLQGFPDGYSAVPFRGKPAADGPRYKAIGNSMAVPVMRWIGQRIQLVETL